MKPTDFPFLTRGITYLDSAASAQKFLGAIQAESEAYRLHYANVHRGLHQLAEEATQLYENARICAVKFLNADNRKEIIFTKGTTEALNLLASSITITKDDIIILTEMEHHSNLVPWQQRALKEGATLKYIPIKNSKLDMEAAKEIISQGCSVLAVAHVSNVLGCKNDIKQLANWVHEQNGKIIVDGAQGAACSFGTIDVQSLDVDAYAFSSHKVYGPTGLGVLYGKREFLESLTPYQFGGEMIREVQKFSSTWEELPHRFEAGTPPIAQAAGLAVALDLLMEMPDGADQLRLLTNYARTQLSTIPQLDIISDSEACSIVSFTLEGIHPHDIAQCVDRDNIAIRAGHHCTQPLHEVLGVKATCRASFGIYNTKNDVDKLVESLKKCVESFNV